MNIASYPTLQKLECILQVLLIGDSGTERSIYTETKTKQKTKTQLITCLSIKPCAYYLWFIKCAYVAFVLILIIYC